MKKLGKALIIISLVSMLLTASIDDSRVMQGEAPSFEPLFIAMSIEIGFMAVGAALIKYNERNDKNGSREKFRK